MTIMKRWVTIRSGNMNIRGIENLPLAEAKELGLEYLKQLKVKRTKMFRLTKDINEAPNSAEVSRILWMLELAGSGDGVIGSAFKGHYKYNA